MNLKNKLERKVKQDINQLLRSDSYNNSYAPNKPLTLQNIEKLKAKPKKITKKPQKPQCNHVANVVFSPTCDCANLVCVKCGVLMSRIGQF